MYPLCTSVFFGNHQYMHVSLSMLRQQAFHGMGGRGSGHFVRSWGDVWPTRPYARAPRVWSSLRNGHPQSLDSMPVWKPPAEAIMPGSELQWGRISSALNQRAAPTRLTKCIAPHVVAYLINGIHWHPQQSRLSLCNNAVCIYTMAEPNCIRYHKLCVQPQVLMTVLACLSSLLYCSSVSEMGPVISLELTCKIVFVQ